MREKVISSISGPDASQINSLQIRESVNKGICVHISGPAR